MLKGSICAALLCSYGIANASPCEKGDLSAESKKECLEADALFEVRGELYMNKGASIPARAAKANEAMTKYKKALQGAQGAERAYIGGKITRLYIFIGDYLLPKSDKSTRRDYFKECQEFVSNEMGVDKVGEDHLQPYYYSRASCWAFKLEMSSVLVKLREKGKLEKFIYKGIAYKGGNDYMAGGIHRSLAGIRSSRAAIAIGAGNTAEAVEQAEMAMETVENDLYNNHTLSGVDYCDNYRYRAEAYLADRRSDIYSKDEATASIEEAFSHFGVEGDLSTFEVTAAPKGVEVDTRVCLERLAKLAIDNELEPEM